MSRAEGNLKTCSKCGETRDVVEFGCNQSSRDGYQWWCRTCRQERWRSLPAERRKAQIDEAVRRRKVRMETEPDFREKMRRQQFKSRTGIAAEARDYIAAYQQGRCAICEVDLGDSGHLDHDHACCADEHMCLLCVRGILCPRCNLALGLFQDDPSVMVRAAMYLEKHRENSLAITHLEEALHWLEHRTKDREARKVEGTHVV